MILSPNKEEIGVVSASKYQYAMHFSIVIQAGYIALE